MRESTCTVYKSGSCAYAPRHEYHRIADDSPSPSPDHSVEAPSDLGSFRHAHFVSPVSANDLMLCGLTCHRVMALTIAGLRSLPPIFESRPPDRPWYTVMPAIWLQLILSSSILCTCIPTLKRVLADLQTGMMAGTVSDFFEQSVSGHTNTGSQSGSKSGSGIGQRSPSTSTPHSRPRRDSIGVERMNSQTILRDHAIMQTTDYEVRYEGRPIRVSSSSQYESDALSIHMVDPTGTRGGSDGWH